MTVPGASARRATTKRPRGGPSHNLCTLKRAVSTLGSRAIDRRTAVGRTLAEWRSSLVADLGGPDMISTQRAALVDLAVKSKLLIDSVDAWLVTQPTLINRRKRALLPVVRERQALADGLARLLGQLGLDRVPQRVPTLAEVLAQPGSGETAPDDRKRPEKSRGSTVTTVTTITGQTARGFSSDGTCDGDGHRDGAPEEVPL